VDGINVACVSLLGPVLTNMRLSREVFVALSHHILPIIQLNKHTSNVINFTFLEPCIVIYVCNKVTDHNMATAINSNKINAVVIYTCVPVNPTPSFRYMYTHVRLSAEFLRTL
jgi:heterodisulfide reductase subunit A-like polyferredoxin